MTKGITELAFLRTSRHRSNGPGHYCITPPLHFRLFPKVSGNYTITNILLFKPLNRHSTTGPIFGSRASYLWTVVRKWVPYWDGCSEIAIHMFPEFVDCRLPKLNTRVDRTLIVKFAVIQTSSRVFRLRIEYQFRCFPLSLTMVLKPWGSVFECFFFRIYPEPLQIV